MFRNFSLFKTPFPGRNSVPPSFVSFFVFYIFSYLLSKTGCFSGCLMSSASIQKLFCGIYLAFKCFFDEFVGKKVFSPSYSSAILAPPSEFYFLWLLLQCLSPLLGSKTLGVDNVLPLFFDACLMLGLWHVKVQGRNECSASLFIMYISNHLFSSLGALIQTKMQTQAYRHGKNFYHE